MVAPDLEKIPCSICGGTNFEWGILFHGWYRSGKVSDINLKSKVVSIRRCLTCQHLDHFIDESASRLSGQITFIILAVALIIAVIFLVLFVVLPNL